MLLGSVAAVSARGERELTDDELRAEMSRNRALAAYVARNGDPDMAESHFLADAPPWDDHEVTLYYVEARKEIGFARAWILGHPDIQLERYERPLSDEQAAALSARSRSLRAPAHTEDVPRMSAPEPVEETPHVTPAAAHEPADDDAQSPTAGMKPMSPDERAEAAARRAEDAATRVEMAADAAEHAADRADAVTAEVHTAYERNLKK
jgi:hypothetical protein